MNDSRRRLLAPLLGRGPADRPGPGVEPVAGGGAADAARLARPARYLNNLGTGLSARYARTGRLEDLEEAIRVYQAAVQRTPPDSPDLP